jgi:hypothetical protein
MDTLTPKQVRDLADAIHTRYGYLHRVRERMHRMGFTPDDELLPLVSAAEDALQRLWVFLHYRACNDGRDRKPGLG